MNDLIVQLSECVDRLAVSAESGKDARRKARVLEQAADVLVDVEPELVEPIRVLAEALAEQSGSVGDADRKLANRVRGLIAAEILDDAEQSMAEAVVAKFAALGKGSGGSPRENAGVTTPDFPFSIKAVYNGETVVWEGQRSGHAYWNSLRHACRKYEQKALGHEDLTGNGDWREAKAAFQNGEQTAHAGLFDLVRV